VSDVTRLEEGMKGGGIDTGGVMAAEAGLCWLDPRPAVGVESAKKQALEDLAKHADQGDGLHVVGVLSPSLVLDDQADHGLVPGMRGACVFEAGVVQRGESMDERGRSQDLHQTDVNAVHTARLGCAPISFHPQTASMFAMVSSGRAGFRGRPMKSPRCSDGPM
jgi:hypothetical protein